MPATKQVIAMGERYRRLRMSVMGGKRAPSMRAASGMRAYIVTSGLIFAGLVLAHVARLVAEGLGPLHEPGFLVSSLLGLVMTGWAAVTSRSKGP
jgi:hypothetical protein